MGEPYMGGEIFVAIAFAMWAGIFWIAWKLIKFILHKIKGQ